ncbi:hypothetical protein Leryth_020800 [Lithospermum erythrorhizon]|nr:hypothetical protein Leryth_020800 [Lithospermum erythrorhizon]
MTNSSSVTTSSGGADSYIGSLISLISNHDIRYEGVMYHLNTLDSTFGLKNECCGCFGSLEKIILGIGTNIGGMGSGLVLGEFPAFGATVRSFGTEGRKKDGPQILPSDKVYEYILFRGSDIKHTWRINARHESMTLYVIDGAQHNVHGGSSMPANDLQVKSSPAVQLEETLYDDPAIIQSHCDGGLPNSSKSFSVGGSLSESGASHDISALNMQPCTSLLLPQQSGSHIGPLNHYSAPDVNAPSHALPMSWSGYSGIYGNNALQYPSQYGNSSIPAVHNLFQTSSDQLSNTTLISPSMFSVPESKVPPLNLPPSSINNSIPISDLFCSASNLPSASVESSFPSYPEMFVGNGLSPSLLSSSSQDRNSTEVSSINNAGPGSLSCPPVQSSYPVSSVVNSSTSLSNRPPKLITPDQISQPRASELLPSPMFFIDQGDVTATSSASSNSSLSITSLAAQPPLLPLPPHAQKLHYSPAINEEFDFEAMNEKFKKDEIWGYLGQSKQGAEGVDDTDGAGQKISDDNLAEKVEAKPAYNKDDFFDSISCNSQSRGARNGHRFSERRKLDTETFGTYQQRIHPNFVAYGSNGTRRGHFSRGMGYQHHGMRGRARYT